MPRATRELGSCPPRAFEVRVRHAADHADDPRGAPEARGADRAAPCGAWSAAAGGTEELRERQCKVLGRLKNI